VDLDNKLTQNRWLENLFAWLVSCPAGADEGSTNYLNTLIFLFN
jgi:hypothetical protein